MSGIQDLMAQSYQAEVNGYYGYNKEDSDDGEEAEMNYYSLDGTYYFEKISLENGPYEEAAFLQKASYLTVDGEWYTYEEGKADLDTWSLGAEVHYVFEPLPIFIGVMYKHSKQDGDVVDYSGSPTDSERTQNQYGIRAGMYAIDTLAVSLFYIRENTKFEYAEYPSSDADVKTNNYGILVELVQPIGNNMSLGVDASYTRIDQDYDSETGISDREEKNNEYEAMATFYVVPQIGIGAGMNVNRGDDKDIAGNTYMVGAKAYVTPNIGIGFGYARFQADDDQKTDDENGFNIQVTGRF
jgi:hypothetical protein